MNRKQLFEKTVTVLSILISAVIILLAVLQIFHVWDGAVNLFIPLLGLNQLGQGYIQWNTNRKIACFNFVTAVFIFICSIVVFFVP